MSKTQARTVCKAINRHLRRSNAMAGGRKWGVRYKIHTGRRFRRFKTLEDAKQFAGIVFERTGIVLAIERE